MGLMPVAEALSRVLVDAHPLPAESAALMDAYGRVLTSDIVALRSQPPADVRRQIESCRVPLLRLWLHCLEADGL